MKPNTNINNTLCIVHSLHQNYQAHLSTILPFRISKSSYVTYLPGNIKQEEWVSILYNITASDERAAFATTD